MNFGGGERSNKTRNKLVLICFYTICKIYKIQSCCILPRNLSLAALPPPLTTLLDKEEEKKRLTVSSSGKTLVVVATF